jgi:L-aminopeptidase/D-esterase-like protein
MNRRVVGQTSHAGTLTRVPGLTVGCAEDPLLASGSTVVLFDRVAPTAIDVRGPASGTYDSQSLSLEATFGRRDALFLSGGSVYGLDAARGVRTSLLNHGRGEGAFGSGYPVPRISGAILYDLPAHPGPIPDYATLGFAAAEAADRSPVPIGRVGAGRGARIGKYLGIGRAVAGGQGSASAAVEGGHVLGVLLVLNSVGAIRDPENGRWLAGPRGPDGKVRPPRVAPRASVRAGPGSGTNLAIVATNAPVDRKALHAIAASAHDGIARAVVPAHTSTEGDLVFASGTGRLPSRSGSLEAIARATDRLGFIASELVVEAARRIARTSRASSATR